jgi:hypothetical protein
MIVNITRNNVATNQGRSQDFLRGSARIFNFEKIVEF